MQFLRHICCALDSANHCDVVVGENKNRRDPLFARKGIFAVCSRIVDLRRASSAQLLSAPLRLQKHSPPANMSGFGDALGRGCEVPSGVTSPFLMSAQMCGSGTRAGQMAMGSVGRIRLSRAPRMKYKCFRGAGARSVGRAAENFRRVANEPNSSLVRAAAQEREFICDPLRISCTPSPRLAEGLSLL